MRNRTFYRKTFSARGSRAFALVLVLSLTVLISLLVVNFLAMSVAGRKISRAQASHYGADLMARSSIQTLVGTILTELKNGSQVTLPDKGMTTYLPLNRGFQFLTRNTGTNQPTILKMSQEGVPFSSANELVPDQNFLSQAINVLSDSPDVKGRAVNRESWNLARLQTGSLSGEKVPHWILLGRNGVISPSRIPSLKKMGDIQPQNPNYAIGRYAYTVYDFGGLLNANQAGAPTVSDDEFKAKRGGISQIDLSLLPGLGQGRLLADWRWKKTASSLEQLKATLFEKTPLMDQVMVGDHGFVSRKDLIHYSKAFPEQVDEAALKYLTHYHRSFNAPSYIPDPKRPRTGVETLARGLDDQINPSALAVRDAKGDALLKRRFPLSLLSILEKGLDFEKIEKYFGLKKTEKPYTWTYDHGNPAKILRLSEVAALNREPDFFETLKAAILVGSLGKNLTPTASFYLINDPDSPHAYSDNQILEIGLNLIDQWDEDSYPTRVYFDNDIKNNGEFYGSENLPSIYRLIDVPHQEGTGAGTPVEFWEQPELWNLHQPESVPSLKAPINLRFVGHGTVYLYLSNNWVTVPTVFALSPITMTSQGQGIGIEFSPTINQSCREPTVLTRNNSIAYGNNLPPDPSYAFVGLYCGKAISPDTNLATGYCVMGNNFSPYIDFELQYQANGEWVTYNRMEKVSRTGGGYFLPSNGTYPHSYFIYRTRSDPRTSRFGNVIQDSFAAPLPGVSTCRPNKTVGSYGWDPIASYPLASFLGWTFTPSAIGNGGVISYGELSENTTRSSTRYLDPDGVLRRADGAYVSGNSDAGYPQMAGNLDSRPVILNRHFRSVGEMGYVFRAMPWKHLDFFTEESADSALLDYFCIEEMPDNAIVSNQIALNAPYEEILKARLQGAIRKERSLSETITKSQAETISKKLMALTQSKEIGLFQNRSELVTRAMSQVDYGNDNDNIIKTRREAVVRALAEGSDTRTWNLMIDLVAQTGGYSSHAKQLSEFNVNSQTRYWYFVSIDRFTGKILDQKWEKVTN